MSAQPTLAARARFTARRLKAAGRQQGFPGRRARELSRRLDRVRRYNERAVVTGPYSHLSVLHACLREWSVAIDLACAEGGRS